MKKMPKDGNEEGWYVVMFEQGGGQLVLLIINLELFLFELCAAI